MRWNTIRLVDAAGALFDIIAWLRTRPAESETHEITAWARSGKHQKPIAIRLIARRKTPDAIEKAHKDLRRQASRKQTQLDPRSLVAADYLVLATSLPAEAFPAREVLAAYRLRWHIELAFKRLKSLMNVDQIRTRSRSRNAMLAVCPPDCRPAVRRPQPGCPGILPLRRCLTPVPPVRCGALPQVVLDAILAAVVPAITLAMLECASATLHKRLANPKRKRKQVVNYPYGRLS